MNEATLQRQYGSSIEMAYSEAKKTAENSSISIINLNPLYTDKWK
jgi:hypothetical protein